MKIYSLLGFVVILIGSLAHSCGTVYFNPQYAYSIAVSPNGAYIATTNWYGGTVSMQKLSNGSLSDPISYSFPQSMGPMAAAFSPDSSLLAIVVHEEGTWYGNVAVFNVSGGQLHNPISYNLPAPSSYPWCLAFSPNGAYLATGNSYPNKDGTHLINDVTIFKVSGGTLTNPVSYLSPSQAGSGYGIETSGIAFSPDGSLLATANYMINGVDHSSTGNVALFNVTEQGVLDAGIVYALPTGSSGPMSLSFSANGSYLATAHPTSNSVTLYAVSEGTLETGTFYLLPMPYSNPQSLSFSPNGSLLATSNSASDGITIFDVTNVLNNGTSYGPKATNSLNPTAVAFSPDGAFLFAANWNYSITMFNTTTWCGNDTMS